MVTEGLGFFFIASGVSLFTLCGISYNRFLAVRYPLKRNLRMSRRSAIIFSILAWVICTVIMVPSLRSFRYESEFTSCIRSWAPINGTSYRLFLLFAGTIFPTVFLLMSYLAILFHARKRPQLESSSKPKSVIKLKKAERLVGILILIYFICWIPNL